MKKFLLWILILVPCSVFADHDVKSATDKGTYAETASINGSSSTGTAFISAASKRMDAILFNNSPAAIYIGTTSAALHGVDVTHENLRIGLVVQSSATFSIQGAFSDNLYFTCKAAQANCNVRVMETKNR